MYKEKKRLYVCRVYSSNYKSHSQSTNKRTLSKIKQMQKRSAVLKSIIAARKVYSVALVKARDTGVVNTILIGSKR